MVLYVVFSLAFVYFLITDIANFIKLDRGVHFGRYADPSADPVSVVRPTEVTTTNHYQDVGYEDDKPLPSTFHSTTTKQPCPIKQFDGESNINENTFGTSAYYSASSNYNDCSYKSNIVGGGNVKPALIRATFQGAESVVDKDHNVQRHTIHTIEKLQDDNRHNRSFREARVTHTYEVSSTHAPDKVIQNLTYSIKQKDLEVPQMQTHRKLETQTEKLNEMS